MMQEIKLFLFVCKNDLTLSDVCLSEIKTLKVRSNAVLAIIITYIKYIL